RARLVERHGHEVATVDVIVAERTEVEALPQSEVRQLHLGAAPDVACQQPEPEPWITAQRIERLDHTEQHAEARAARLAQLLREARHVALEQLVEVDARRVDALPLEDLRENRPIGPAAHRNAIERAPAAVQPLERRVHPAHAGALGPDQRAVDIEENENAHDRPAARSASRAN